MMNKEAFAKNGASLFYINSVIATKICLILLDNTFS